MSHDVPSLETNDLRDVLIRSGNSCVEYTRDRAPTAASRQKKSSAFEAKGGEGQPTAELGPTTRTPSPVCAALCLGLGSRCRTPKGTGIGSIRVKLQHPGIELAGGFCRVIQPNEVTDVLARFLHIFRTVIVAGNLMSRNNR